MSKALEAAAKAADDFEGNLIFDYLMTLKHRGHEDGDDWVDGGNSDGERLCGLIGLGRGRHPNVKVNAAICRATEALSRDLAAAIIRAFAENLTDEMVDAFFNAKVDAKPGCVATIRAKEGIRAAIREGLK